MAPGLDEFDVLLEVVLSLVRVLDIMHFTFSDTISDSLGSLLTHRVSGYLKKTHIILMSQLMRLWYLSHRRPAKAQASLRIRAVSPEHSLFAHMKYGSRRRVRPKIRHLAPLDGCTCMFEECVYRGRKVP